VLYAPRFISLNSVGNGQFGRCIRRLDKLAAAGNIDCLAINIISFVGSQESDYMGRILGLANALARVALRLLLPKRLVWKNGAIKLGVGKPRRHTVNPDFIRSKLAGAALSEFDNPGLSRAISANAVNSGWPAATGADINNYRILTFL